MEAFVQSIPTRAELLAALANPDFGNPLAAALDAAIVSYGEAVNAQALRAGGVPNPVLLEAPRTEIEAFAIELLP